MVKKTLCICGGGALAHTSAGYIASHGQFEVRVLTRHPQQWSHQLTIDDANGRQFVGRIPMITSNAREAVNGADIVLLCVPGFAIADVLKQVAPHLDAAACVGSIVSSTGFFFMAQELLPAATSLFGFQRVPFIARVKDYGHSAVIKGYKSKLFVATMRMNCHQQQAVISDIELMFNMPSQLLNSHYEASLTNSNPLLHTSRIYSMWRDWHPGMRYDYCPQFYADWTVEAAHYYIMMDNELQQLLRFLPVVQGAIPSVLDYYECSDEQSLTTKLRSIDAFKGILSPMVGSDADGYVPDFNSRYFTEDFPFGLRWIVEVARQLNASTPTIDEVYRWGKAVIHNNSHQCGQ